MNDLAKGNLNIKVVASIVIGAILTVVSFYKVVVIPINNMQLQLADIQLALTANKNDYTKLIEHVNEQDTRIGNLENKLKK